MNMYLYERDKERVIIGILSYCILIFHYFYGNLSAAIILLTLAFYYDLIYLVLSIKHNKRNFFLVMFFCLYNIIGWFAFIYSYIEYGRLYILRTIIAITFADIATYYADKEYGVKP